MKSSKDWFGWMGSRRRVISAKNSFERGIAKCEQKDHRGAIDDLTEAIKLNPYHSDSYFNRRVCRREIKEYEGVIADCSS
jgi:hypothetical protein